MLQRWSVLNRRPDFDSRQLCVRPSAAWNSTNIQDFIKKSHTWNHFCSNFLRFFNINRHQPFGEGQYHHFLLNNAQLPSFPASFIIHACTLLCFENISMINHFTGIQIWLVVVQPSSEWNRTPTTCPKNRNSEIQLPLCGGGTEAEIQLPLRGFRISVSLL